MSEKKSLGEPPSRGGNGPKKAKDSAAAPARTQQRAADPFEVGFDYLLVNGPIDDDLFSQIVTEIVDHKKNDKVVLCLVTHGGQANAAYRIGRFLQSVYLEVVAFVPSVCKSAGTLVVTAANRVVMPITGEIGPLDVQLVPRDEILGYRSGLTTRSALQDLQTQAFELFNHFLFEITRRSEGNISFRLASDIAVKATVGCMSPIYEKINPDALGQDLRDLNVATEYCKRLSAKSKNLKASAITKLVHNYPSHNFVIDYEDAKDIFISLSRSTKYLREVFQTRSADTIVPRTSDPLVELLDLSPDEEVEQSPAEPLEASHEKETDRQTDGRDRATE